MADEIFKHLYDIREASAAIFRIGQREQARVALATAIALYRAMDMTFWLPQTQATLAQVDGY